MRRLTYQDKVTTIIDVIDENGLLQARRTTHRNEFGSIEKEYHKVFAGNGLPDPVEDENGKSRNGKTGI